MYRRPHATRPTGHRQTRIRLSRNKTPVRDQPHLARRVGISECIDPILGSRRAPDGVRARVGRMRRLILVTRLMPSATKRALAENGHVAGLVWTKKRPVRARPRASRKGIERGRWCKMNAPPSGWRTSGTTTRHRRYLHRGANACDDLG